MNDLPSSNLRPILEVLHYLPSHLLKGIALASAFLSYTCQFSLLTGTGSLAYRYSSCSLCKKHRKGNEMKTFSTDLFLHIPLLEFFTIIAYAHYF
jgi:hypothetical protein